MSRFDTLTADTQDDADRESSIIPNTEIMNQLCIFEPKGETEEHETQFGPTTAVEVLVTDLDHPDGPKVWDGTIYSRFIKTSLLKHVGGMVLGRVYQGTKGKKGKPPWLLEDASGEPEAVKRAEAYLDKRDGKVAPAKVKPKTKSDQPKLPDGMTQDAFDALPDNVKAMLVSTTEEGEPPF